MNISQKELAEKIEHCSNMQALNKLCDIYYDNIDDEMKERFYDMYTILFNKEMLNSRNYTYGCICGSVGVNELLQSEINRKYEKLRSNYNGEIMNVEK